MPHHIDRALDRLEPRQHEVHHEAEDDEDRHESQKLQPYRPRLLRAVDRFHLFEASNGCARRVQSRAGPKCAAFPVTPSCRTMRASAPIAARLSEALTPQFKSR